MSARAGDPSREAEVVLDARGCARLAAEGAAIEHQGREALRRGVDRRGEPRRARADDRHVVDLRRVDRRHEAEATREVDLAGVAQEAAVRAYDDGQLMRRDLEALEQRTGTGVDV